MLSAPFQPSEAGLFSDAGARTSMKFLSLADLDILIFGDFAFVKYPFRIAFSGNSDLHLAASA